ncbi:MAG: ABC transporter permease [Candidatus Bipolaricaulia bacterium]
MRSWFSNKQVLIGVTIILTFTIMGIFAPVIAPYHYSDQDLSNMLDAPSKAHLFGTDQLGRDVFSRVLYGIRTSLISAFGTATVAGIVGVILGLLAGYFGGWVDRMIQSSIDLAWSFPTLLLAIALVVALRPGQLSIIIAIAAGWWAQYARVVRGEVLATKEDDFVEAARALGSSNFRILFRQILPNILPVTVVLVSTTMGRAIIIETTLSFLGLGVQPPKPSWGIMLSDGRDVISMAPWVTLFPGIAISLSVLGFNFLGDGLRDLLDPYIRSEG